MRRCWRWVAAIMVILNLCTFAGVSPAGAATNASGVTDYYGVPSNRAAQIGAFSAAAGTTTPLNFDDIAAGTDIGGRSFGVAGLTTVTFSKGSAGSAPLLIEDGNATFTTPTGNGAFPNAPADRSSFKLFPTTGSNVVSPGGLELAPGPNPAVEDDSMVVTFDPPVPAVGFDVLFQSLDGASFTTVFAYDARGTQIYASSGGYSGNMIPTGVGGANTKGDAVFVGLTSTSANIARVVINDLDNSNDYPDSNLGYDSFRVGTTGLTRPAASPTAPATIIPYNASGYLYKQVGAGAESGFEQPGYDTATFQTGQAAFGYSPCSNFPSAVHTPWSPNTDMLVRKSFTWPAGATHLHITGTIDNDATLYVNGTQVQYVRSGSCATGAIDIVVDDALLRAGDNLLAVRGHDYGGGTYLDFTATADVPSTGGTPGGTACVPTYSGLVSSYSMEGSIVDGTDGNNPAAVNAVGFAQGKAGQGATLGQGGYIEIPDAANLRNQAFTIQAWARPDGPSTNNDEFGSTIVVKDIGNTDVSAALNWSAQDSRFVFLFGNQSTERIRSADTFPAGTFHHVAGTYDGSRFALYVDGQLQGQVASVKTIPYDTSIPWSIGSAPANIRVQGYPRTWNGVIDEVQFYNRALSVAEIQGVVSGGNGCPGTGGTGTGGGTPIGPVDGTQPGFPATPYSYMGGAITVDPYPAHTNATNNGYDPVTLGVLLQNPTASAAELAAIDFYVSGYSIGSLWGAPIKTLHPADDPSGLIIPANGTLHPSFQWTATLQGHHCVQVRLTFQDGHTQTLQRNLDFPQFVTKGGTGTSTFHVGGDPGFALPYTLSVVKVASSPADGWNASLSATTVTAAGDVTLTVTAPDAAVGYAIYNVEARDASGRLVGGISVTFVIGTALPAPAIAQPVGSYSAGSVALAGTGLPYGYIRVLLDGGVVGETLADGTGAWHVTVTAANAHGLFVSQSIAGTESARTFLPGAQPPAIPGGEPGFPATPYSYMGGAITISPYPVTSLPATETLGVLLQNPTGADVTLSRIDFYASGYGIGGSWAPIGAVTAAGQLVIPANGTAHPTIRWAATLAGHHCVQARLTFQDGHTQTLQRNLDFPQFVGAGGTGTSTFHVGGDPGFAFPYTLRAIQVAASPADGWSASLSQTTVGAEADVTLTVTAPNAASGYAIYNVEAYDASGRLAGGISVTIVIGTALPAPIITSPAAGGVSNPVTIRGTALPYATIRAALADGTFLFEVLADGSGSWSGGAVVIGQQTISVTQGVGGAYGAAATLVVTGPGGFVPLDGNRPGFPATAYPYMGGAITIDPYPVASLPASETLGVLLQNKTAGDVTLNRIDFYASNYGMGLFWTPIGSITDAGKLLIPAGGTAHPTFQWQATLQGHHCVQVLLYYSDGTVQRLQRNLDFPTFFTPGGGPVDTVFTLGNPLGGPATIDLTIVKVGATGDGWAAGFGGDGAVEHLSVALAPGQLLDQHFFIVPPANGGYAVYNVEARIGGILIGGISKTVVVGGTMPTPAIAQPVGGYLPGRATIGGTGVPGAYIRLYLDGGVIAETVADDSGAWSVTVTVTGGHSIFVSQTVLGGAESTRVEVPGSLVPIDGTSAGFPATKYPYMGGAITIDPYPVATGTPVKLGVILQNPTAGAVTLSHVDFSVSGYGIGGSWGAVGGLGNVTIPAGQTIDGRLAAGLAHPTIDWVPTLTGHHCVQVLLYYSDGHVQRLQRNLDFPGFATGGAVQTTFAVGGDPALAGKTITLKVVQVGGRGTWNAALSATTVVAGATGTDMVLTVAGGGGDGDYAIYNVEGYLDGGVLVGGISRTIVYGTTVPAPTVLYPLGGDVPGQFLVRGTALPYARIRCVHGGGIIEVIADGNGNWSLPVGAADGADTLRITQVVGGVESASFGGGIGVQVIHGLPGGFAVAGIQPGGSSGGANLHFRGSGTPGATIRITSTDPISGQGTVIGDGIAVGADGLWDWTSGALPNCDPSFTFAMILPNGGGTAGWPAGTPGYRVIIDTQAPTVTVATPLGGSLPADGAGVTPGALPQGANLTVTLTDLLPGGKLGTPHTSGVDPAKSSVAIDGKPLGVTIADGQPIQVPAPSGLGKHTLTVTATDRAGQTTTRTSTFYVFAYPAQGQFVVGDIASGQTTGSEIGRTAYYWGSQWYRNNAMTGTAAPPQSFKGYDNNSQSPTVGGTWTSLPGNSAVPPAGVPAYLGVIVASHTDRTGAASASSDNGWAGDIVEIVVVQTNAGYGSDPGHAGTGTIVAVYK